MAISGDFAPLLSAANAILATHGYGDINLGRPERLSNELRRNLLVRCSDLNDDSSSYIIKQIQADQYDAADHGSWDVRRFVSDWAGVAFLNAISTPQPLAPRFYGGDLQNGFIILEDLGPPHDLVKPLLEGGAAAALDVLLTLATQLGRLHGATSGRKRDFDRLFATVHPQARPFTLTFEGLGERFKKFTAGLERVGVAPETGLQKELGELATALVEPGPFETFIHGDPCPDNIMVTANQVRLIDFEVGATGHALIDGVYGRMMFPTCWCANRLPEPVILAMEQAYRTALLDGCPAAGDDRLFGQAVVVGCAYWLIENVVRHLEVALEQDPEWGIANLRPRLLSRLAAFISTAEKTHEYQALRGSAAALMEKLHRLWPDSKPLPLYPAFSTHHS